MGGSRPAGVRAGGWGDASGAPGPRSASMALQAGQETSAGCPTAADAERIAGGGGVLIGRTSWWLESSADFRGSGVCRSG